MIDWERELELNRFVNEMREKGFAAMKGGWLQEAENFYAAAVTREFKAGRRCPLSVLPLAEVYAKQGRTDDAITALERVLPLPQAFHQLICLFRVQGKAAMKAGDSPAALAWFNRMLSMSALLNGLKPLGERSRGSSEYETLGSQWLAEVKGKTGTLYAWSYARDGAVPNDANLSDRDYKTLHKLTFDPAPEKGEAR